MPQTKQPELFSSKRHCIFALYSKRAGAPRFAKSSCYWKTELLKQVTGPERSGSLQNPPASGPRDGCGHRNRRLQWQRSRHPWASPGRWQWHWRQFCAAGQRPRGQGQSSLLVLHLHGGGGADLHPHHGAGHLGGRVKAARGGGEHHLRGRVIAHRAADGAGGPYPGQRPDDRQLPSCTITVRLSMAGGHPAASSQ